MWKRSRNYGYIKDYAEDMSGENAKELLFPKSFPVQSIPGLRQASGIIKKAVSEGKTAVIVGSHNLDGIIAAAGLSILFSHLRIHHKLIIPEKTDDQFQKYETAIKNFRNSLIITLGIRIPSAEAIEAVKQGGNIITIMDHHTPPEKLPEADCIVAPHIPTKEESDFDYSSYNTLPERYKDYCASGLVLKLTECMSEDSVLHSIEISLAAIGTIAAAVPLTGDNRYIVKKGLENINSPAIRKTFPAGFQQILNTFTGTVTEETIKYHIIPLLNVPDLRYSNGSTATLKVLKCIDLEKAEYYHKKLVSITKEWKDLDEIWTEVIFTDTSIDWGKCPAIAFKTGIPVWLTGTIAEKAAKSVRKPVFIFTQSSDGSSFIGSGRTYKSFDLTPIMDGLKEIAAVTERHRGAYDITVDPYRFSKLIEVMESHESCKKYKSKAETVFFDFEITVSQIPDFAEEIQKFAPWGDGFPRPIFRINNFRPDPRYIVYFGSRNQHFKISSKYADFFAYNLSAEYDPRHSIDIIGYIQKNPVKESRKPQFIVMEVKK